MAIEIYDKAKVIKKGDTVYYLLKGGSKNCYTLPYQTRINNDLRNEYMRRESRESDWTCVCYGSIFDHSEQRVAHTCYNCPTSYVYGQIRFGNKKNIALFWAKTTPADYETLDDIQKYNFDKIVQQSKEYSFSLDNIPESKFFKHTHNYCGREFTINGGNVNNYAKAYNGRIYWDLDNL